MNSGLHLYYARKKQFGELPDLMIRILVSSLLFMAVLLTVTSMFQLKYQVLITECFGIALVFAISLFWEKKHIIYGMILVVTGFFVIGFFLGSKFVVDGMFILVNQGIDEIALKTGEVYTKFAVNTSEGNYDLFATFFMVIFSSVLALFCGIAINGRFKRLLFILLVILIVPMMLLGIVPGKWHSAFFVVCVLLAFGYISTPSDQWRVQLVTAVVMGGILVVSLGLSLIIAPSNEAKPIFPNLMEKMRYGIDETNNYPMGQLEQLKSIEKTEKTAIEITMEQPQVMYLKGYVGSYFDNQNWKDLPATIHNEYNSMFYWMHDMGMYGQNQLAYVNYLYEDEIQGNVEKSLVKIKNIGANRKYLYLPYEIIDLEGFSLKNNSDTSAEDGGFRGQKKYEFEISSPLWKDTDLAGKKVFDLLLTENPRPLKYENAESHYNSFVYENYTSITDEQKEVLQRLLYYPPFSSGNHMDYDEAMSYIYQYLSATLTYDENASLAAKDEDFLRSLLMEEKTGCDIHFATAATIMYRYLGIPARYVEGYVVTAEDVLQMKPGESYDIKGTNIHAWTEVYYDTIGWVPVEFTPGFFDKMKMVTKQ